MKCITFILLVVAGAIAKAGDTPAPHALPASHYDLAEVIFRDCTPPDSKKVFHLFYKNRPLPPDFLSRFDGQPLIVRSTAGGTIVVDQKHILDRRTRREAIALDIQEIRITGETAEVQVFYSASFTSNSTRFHLVRERGGWRVKERKMEWIACG